MKQTVVPAQITTVEDKIAGSLSLQQLMLLTMAVLTDFVIYAALPKPMKLTVYKLTVAAFVSCVLSLAALRVKGKILLLWAITIAHYNLRPRHYVFDKNDVYLRALSRSTKQTVQRAEPVSPKAKPATIKLDEEDKLKLADILSGQTVKLRFNSGRKGGLHVYISETE
ncbi:MAG: PrgI family mobile element protein [Candidatus Saccharimonadales bacterium]